MAFVYMIQNELEDGTKIRAVFCTSLALCSTVCYDKASLGSSYLLMQLLMCLPTLMPILEFNTALRLMMLFESVILPIRCCLSHCFLSINIELAWAPLPICKAFGSGQYEVCIGQHWTPWSYLLGCKFHT